MRITNFILSLLAVTTFSITVCARTHGHDPHPAATPSASPKADKGKSNKDNKQILPKLKAKP